MLLLHFSYSDLRIELTFMAVSLSLPPESVRLSSYSSFLGAQYFTLVIWPRVANQPLKLIAVAPPQGDSLHSSFCLCQCTVKFQPIYFTLTKGIKIPEWLSQIFTWGRCWISSMSAILTHQFSSEDLQNTSFLMLSDVSKVVSWKVVSAACGFQFVPGSSCNS